MPSTYTTNGGIELIANGEQSGTWGSTTNTNLQIVDRLTNGVGAISLSGTTHTLTTSDGALSDGQYSVLVFGGSPSGTNTVTISPNNAQHVYFIKNGSGESVVLTQGSGGDVTIADGKSAIIYADGAGASASVVDLTATFVATGALLASNNLSDLGDASTALTNLGITATAAELNTLDGVTATAAELNYVDGVTSGIQGQLDAKQATITGAATTVTSSDLTASRVVVSDAGGKLAVSGVTTAELNILDGVTATTAELNILDGVTATTAELNYVDGVTSGIQGQLDAKQATITGAATTVTSSDLTASRVVVSDAGGKLAVSGVTTAELNILDGVTATTAELNILDGVTATTAELNILDGVTATAAELNYVDIVALGTSQASKVVTADANGNIKLSEEVQATCYIETAVSVPSTTIDCAAGNFFYKTISANTTFTFDYSGINLTADDAYGFSLLLTTSGTVTVTWPASVNWPAGASPDAPPSGETDMFVFVTRDGGTTWYGFTAGQMMA